MGKIRRLGRRDIRIWNQLNVGNEDLDKVRGIRLFI